MDGSNCSDAGDRFCDTGPDYLNFRWTCVGTEGTSSCEHIDNNGESFFPSGKNTMSYSNDFCVTEFSGEQSSAMNIDLDNRPDLQPSTAPNANPIDVAPVLSEPGDGNTTAYVILDFTWTAVPNANRYVFQVSTSPSFNENDIVISNFLNDNEVTLNYELDPSTTYHWRVMPFSDVYTCADFTLSLIHI